MTIKLQFSSADELRSFVKGNNEELELLENQSDNLRNDLRYTQDQLFSLRDQYADEVARLRFELVDEKAKYVETQASAGERTFSLDCLKKRTK
jgi:hypothetical protein